MTSPITKTTHTPGPWKWGTDWDKFQIDPETGDPTEKYLDIALRSESLFIHGQGAMVIPVRVDHYGVELDYAGDEPFSKADRALLAAAPDLLEALRECLEVICGNNAVDAHNAIAEARAALARVEGGE